MAGLFFYSFFPMTKFSPISSHLSPLFLCLLLLGATACTRNQRPDEVLDADAMVDVLTDLYLIEGYYAVESQYRFDSDTPEVIDACDAVLEKHHLTHERMDISFDYYSKHPDEYQTIQEQVAARIEEITAPDKEYSR